MSKLLADTLPERIAQVSDIIVAVTVAVLLGLLMRSDPYDPVPQRTVIVWIVMWLVAFAFAVPRPAVAWTLRFLLSNTYLAFLLAVWRESNGEGRSYLALFELPNAVLFLYYLALFAASTNARRQRAQRNLA